MKLKLLSISIAALAAMSMTTLLAAGQAAAPFVRLAVLDVDHAQVEAFKTASRAHISAALAAEPGILAIHEVAEKDEPDRIHVFEMYVDAKAYQSHLESPHFKRFVASTASMVTRRTLHDAWPVRLGAKPALPAAPLVRVAEIAVAADRLAAYNSAVSEEIDASIRLEPGVIAIYAVALKDQPEQLRFLEIYADEQAYREHIASPHFRKYVDSTKDMLLERRLIETEPIALRMKQR
jgi:quinol monooxygenase YgiN